MKNIYMENVTKKDIEEFKKLGYKYIIKAKDKFLSAWGDSANKPHLQIILCRTSKELELILKDLRSDKSFDYVVWNYLEYKYIYNYTRNKTYTIRNDWTRSFYDEADKKSYLEGME